MTTIDLLELLHLTARRYQRVAGRVRHIDGDSEERFKVRLRQGQVSSDDRGGGRHRRWRQCAFDPNVVIPELWLEPIGQTTVAGREGIIVRGKRRRTTHDYYVLPTISEEWELVADAERGVLLRLAALADGEERLVYEIEEITFDQ